MASITEAADRVRELMQRVATAAGVDAEVRVREEDDRLHGEFVGSDLAPLIGRRGETIDAIQHLAYRFAGRGGAARPQVLIDAAGYRERRAAALRSAADQAVASALNTGRPVPLESMSALERKVIHEYLKDRHDVETYSEGQEPSRHLVIAPLLDA
jgi:spoIIIJ-associated protein